MLIVKERKKDVKRDYAHGKRHTRHSLDFIDDMIELADDVSADELSFCKSKINQAKSFKGERHDETLNRFKSKKDIDKPPNQAMKASGVTIMPLLCGKTQFGKLTKKQINFVIEEIQQRQGMNLSDDGKKAGIRSLVKTLKKIICPPNDNVLTEQEIESQKFFLPVHQTASDWFCDTTE